MDLATAVDIPFSIEPVTGWRAWRLTRGRNQVLTLLSLAAIESWPPRARLVADCRRRAHAEPAPVLHCTCGIYATDSPEHLRRIAVGVDGASVAGTISMWGTIVEHEWGARSRFAYPSRLAVICEACFREGNGLVPASTIDPFSFTTACDRHGPVPGPSVPASEVEAELLSAYGVDRLPVRSAPRLPVVGAVAVATYRTTTKVAVATRTVSAAVAVATQPTTPKPARSRVGYVVVGLLLIVLHWPRAPAAPPTPGIAPSVPAASTTVTFDHPRLRPR